MSKEGDKGQRKPEEKERVILFKHERDGFDWAQWMSFMTGGIAGAIIIIETVLAWLGK